VRFKEFKFAVIRSNFIECVSRKLVMMLTRDVYFIARPVVFKMCYSGCSWRSHFFAGVERHECLFSNALRDILNFVD